jgi:hypothetical protein
MVSYPGVKKVYKDSEELQNWFKRIFSLALIRKIDFLDELDTIINRKDCLSKVIGDNYTKAYINYLHKTYTNEDSRYPFQMWNHYQTDYGRTNNPVEGQNNKMKLYCGAAHPDIFKATKLLRQYESTNSDKFDNAIGANGKSDKQSQETRDRNLLFNLYRKQLDDGIITFKKYHEYIMDLYKFQPKKKYIEELIDTDESELSDNDENDKTDDEIEEPFDENNNTPCTAESSQCNLNLPEKGQLFSIIQSFSL